HEGFIPYMGSKAALAAATKGLAKELGRFGIRVNGVHSGYIENESRRVRMERPCTHGRSRECSERTRVWAKSRSWEYRMPSGGKRSGRASSGPRVPTWTIGSSNRNCNSMYVHRWPAS